MSSISERDPAIRVFLARYAAFAAEQLPFALLPARRAIEAAIEAAEPAFDPASPESIDGLRPLLVEVLHRRLRPTIQSEADLETTPGSTVGARIEIAVEHASQTLDGFVRREAIAASLAADERREILRGMILTRAVDNELKRLFGSGSLSSGGRPFAGRGFRSLGQEAIYAAGIRLRRGRAYRRPEGWRGDVVAPLIRDLGVALAMRPGPAMVRSVLAAQAGKIGSVMAGRDFHIGDLEWGVLPPAAPLAIAPATATGMAFAMSREGAGRVAVAFVGEGATSLGEWHESINLAAAHKLPAVFTVENNQIALSTATTEQSAVRTFADKAPGYGILGVTIDGTDPDAIASAFTWATDRARAGFGPTLIEVVAMRMCGHAHHDDRLYLGHDPEPSWDYPEPRSAGYVDRDAWDHWAQRDPIARYGERLLDAGIVTDDEIAEWRNRSEHMTRRERKAVVESPWPSADSVGLRVTADGFAARRLEVLAPALASADAALPRVTAGLPFDAAGATFLEGITRGLADALDADPRVLILGQDVGEPYGNAFMVLRSLLDGFSTRIVNTPLAENAILGTAVGAALEGLRPVAEIQFNDFIASGFDQLVNNAAKVRYRWGGSVPIVVRLPWGGLRGAGPFHSQCTEAWFYRVPGLKIVVPSTPEDARALLIAAIEDPDPVLFYEHIGLYRAPRIRQVLDDVPPLPQSLGTAALRRAGTDVAIISYGAYVHRALDVAAHLAEHHGIEAAVLDLRSLVPLDEAAVLATTRACGKVLIVHEDTRRGSIGESIAACIQERAFGFLDAPIRILGSLDTPIPYAPPLEDAFLVSEDEIIEAARLLVAY